MRPSVTLAGTLSRVADIGAFARGAARAVPRIIAVVLGIALLSSGHLGLELVGALVLGTAVSTNWRQWAQYIRTGQEIRMQPEEKYRRPGTHRVELVAVGARPIEVIKAVREVTATGLLEAKRLVDSVPTVLAANLSPESAQLIHERIE